MKTCEVENCKYPVFSKKKCKFHQERKPIKKVSDKGKIKMKEKKNFTELDKLFYQRLWESPEEEYQNHYCYECGKGLSEPLILYFHHLIYKEHYPQFRYLVKNIAIICGDCHTQTHRDIDKTPKLKELTNNLKELLL